MNSKWQSLHTQNSLSDKKMWSKNFYKHKEFILELNPEYNNNNWSMVEAQASSLANKQQFKKKVEGKALKISPHLHFSNNSN